MSRKEYNELEIVSTLEDILEDYNNLLHQAPLDEEEPIEIKLGVISQILEKMDEETDAELDEYYDEEF